MYEQYDDNGTDHGYDDNGSDYGYNDDNGTDHGNDGNESDYGYNDENMSDDNGIPVFYLSSVNLDDLDLVGDGYSEGNYIVDEREIHDEFMGTFHQYWLEPVVELDGEWSHSEEEDDIQTSYVDFYYIEEYFEQNSIEPVGYLYEQYDGNGTDHGYDDNGSDYGYNDENMSDDNDIPVFYLSSENLAGLGVLGQDSGHHALIEEKLWDGAVNQEVIKFSLTPAEMVQEGNNDLGWIFVEGATSQQLAASYDDNKQALNQYFESNGISVQGYIARQHDDTGTGTDENLLDGSVIYITGEDSVNETLIFENGTVTSIFDEEGQEPFTSEGLVLHDRRRSLKIPNNYRWCFALFLLRK